MLITDPANICDQDYQDAVVADLVHADVLDVEADVLDADVVDVV